MLPSTIPNHECSVVDSAEHQPLGGGVAVAGHSSDCRSRSILQLETGAWAYLSSFLSLLVPQKREQGNVPRDQHSVAQEIRQGIGFLISPS